MDDSCSVLSTGHRRGAARLRLATPAVFTGYEGREAVVLLDLSQTGARIAFQSPPRSPAGFLNWMEFETFGDIVWHKGLYAGLQFDVPIMHEWLIETRHNSIHVELETHREIKKAAREWVGI